MPAQGTEKIKKVLPIIYAIDTSGSMSGDRISAVNEAMHDCEEVLREKASDLPESEIKIAALEFSSGAKWITKGGLVALEDFYWNDATAGGVTDLGEALKELGSKLSRSAFLVSETGFSLPVIIFMSDGGPTDNWKKELKAVTDNNRWFKDSRKVAIAIGDDAACDAIANDGDWTKLFGIVGVLLAIPVAAILSFIYDERFIPWLEKKSKARAQRASEKAEYSDEEPEKEVVGEKTAESE